jgi:hypothetical protein
MDREANPGAGSNYLQFGADSGCGPTYHPKIDRWDFIRYGTLSSGEQVVSSDPREGFVDARSHPALDRFTVTYDEPNYVYIDEITVQSEPWAQAHGPDEGADGTGLAPAAWEASADDTGLAPWALTGALNSALITPSVIATRRQDNGPPETVEIVLDRPIPYNATTRFTFNDGTLEQSVDFTYAPGDTDGDGDADLADFSYFARCFESTQVAGLCLLFDADGNSVIDLADYIAFGTALAGE